MVRTAVVAIGNAIPVTVAVIAVSDSIAVEITVGSIKTRLVPMIAPTTGAVDVGNAMAIMTAVYVVVLLVPPVVLPIVEFPQVTGHALNDMAGLRKNWCMLHANARNGYIDGEVHLAAGKCS